MRYIKISSILLVSTILIAIAINCVASPVRIGRVEALENHVLSSYDLKRIFPDANFRNVVTRYLKNEKITLENIANLSEEFYAVNEDIEDITGIQHLKNVENFVFSNNHIKIIPREILKLDKIKSINLSNNYITENEILNKLSSKNVQIDSNLNFINSQSNQYKLNSHYKNIVLKKGERVLIYKLLYKDTCGFGYALDVSNRIPIALRYSVKSDGDNIKVKNDFYIEATSVGKSNLKISLDDNFYNNSSVDISVEVIDE